jgi:proline dehydrogenase
MLARFVPAGLVRWFARPYVAGDSVEDGLAVAARILEREALRTTLDLLGESARTPEQVAANVAAYRRLVDAVAGDPRFAEGAARPSVSLKPSAFTAGAPAAAAAGVEGVAAHAHGRGVAVTVDMEDRRWTDVTLDLCVALFRKGYDVGAVLQTRLDRTEADLARIPAGMRVRLVIGIYPEPPEVATTDKRRMKERMVAYARRLLEAGARVEFATHDERTLEEFARDVAPLAPGRCEVQMLLGVPRAAIQRRLQAGELGVPLPVRLYVPFALSWDDATAYLRRRMDESPSMAWLVLRNLLRRRNGRNAR